MKRPCLLVVLVVALGGGCGEEQQDVKADERIPCQETPSRLWVEGSSIMRMCGTQRQAVRLLGINRSGFQHKQSLAQAGIPDPEQEFAAWKSLWKVEIIRFPLAQDLFLQQASYQTDLDRVVEAARTQDLYLMLEIHGLSTSLNLGQPNSETELLWAALARRYGKAEHVLFDLWNEPHSLPWSEWKQIAEKLTAVIRQAGASETPVVIGGLDYAYDLSALEDSGNEVRGSGPLIYATHPYPYKGDPPHRRKEWAERFGRIALRLPLMVTEYGVDGSGERPFGFPKVEEAMGWLSELHQYIDDLQLSALAWSGGDKPQLTLGRGGGPVRLPDAPPDASLPTDPFGKQVQRWMLQP